MNIQAKQKAKELIEFFSSIIPIEASINDTAEEAIRKMRNDWIATKKCATKVCDEVLSDMGSDRGYEFWADVKQAIQDYE